MLHLRLNYSIIIVQIERLHILILEYTSNIFYGITVGTSAIHKKVFHTKLLACLFTDAFLCLLCYSACPFVDLPHRISSFTPPHHLIVIIQ